MEFKAVILMALVYVIINYVKLFTKGHDDPRLVQTLVFLAGIAAVFLMAETVWANEQIIGGKTLDTLNSGSKIVAGFLVGTGATIIDRIEGTVRNIGQNDRPDPSA